MRTYNSEVAVRYYRADRERRAKADKNGEILTYCDSRAMVVKV